MYSSPISNLKIFSSLNHYNLQNGFALPHRQKIEKRARSLKFVLEERGLVVVVFRKSDPPPFFFLLWLQRSPISNLKIFSNLNL